MEVREGGTATGYVGDWHMSNREFVRHGREKERKDLTYCAQTKRFAGK